CQEADRLYKTAIKESSPDSLIRANLMLNCGRNALRIGPSQEVFNMLMSAMELFKKLGDERGRAGVGLALAEFSMRVGDSHHALLFWDGVLDFAKRVGDEPMCFEASFGSARVYLAQEEVDKAKPAFQDALRSAHALSDREREADVQRVMAEAGLTLV